MLDLRLAIKSLFPRVGVKKVIRWKSKKIEGKLRFSFYDIALPIELWRNTELTALT
jgi:hypothetical protein